VSYVLEISQVCRSSTISYSSDSSTQKPIGSPGFDIDLCKERRYEVID